MQISGGVREEEMLNLKHSVFTFPRSQLTRLVQLPLDLLCAPNTMCLSEKSVARLPGSHITAVH